jgi:hypothetical protein
MSLRALSCQVNPDQLLVISSSEFSPVFRTFNEGIILIVGIGELRVSSIQTCCFAWAKLGCFGGNLGLMFIPVVTFLTPLA